MPLLGLGKAWLDPHLSLPHGLLVGLSRVVAAHCLEVDLVEAALDLPPVRTRGALGLERASVAASCRCLVNADPFGVLVLAEAQCLAAGTAVAVSLGIKGELVATEERRAAIEVRSLRSERIPSKNITNCSLKKTTGSMLGRPRSAYRACSHSRTNERASFASRWR